MAGASLLQGDVSSFVPLDERHAAAARSWHRTSRKARREALREAAAEDAAAAANGAGTAAGEARGNRPDFSAFQNKVFGYVHGSSSETASTSGSVASSGSLLGSSLDSVHDVGDLAGGSGAAWRKKRRKDDLSQLPPGRALCCCGPRSKVRGCLFRFVHWNWTERFIGLCIVINLITLALNSPVLDPESRTATFIKYTDLVVGIIFSIEVVSRIIAAGAFTNRRLARVGCCKWEARPYEDEDDFDEMFDLGDLTDGDHDGGLDPHALAVATGLSPERAPSAGTMLRHASWDERRQMKTGASRLLNKRGRRKVVWRKDVAYFRDPWYILDFVVIVSYWTSEVEALNAVNLSAFRALRGLRALRPLYALKYFQGIRTILESLSISVRVLLDVLFFMFFFFVLYAISGVQFFAGSMHRRCVLADTGELVEPFLYCGLGHGTDCPPHMVCDPDASLSSEFLSFDTIPKAALTIFTLISLEGWVDVNYAIQNSEFGIAWLYFVSLIVFVSFLVLNLFVAVITDTFSKVREMEQRSAFAKVSKVENKGYLVVSDLGWRFVNQLGEISRTGRWGRCSRSLRRIVDSTAFEFFITFLIVVNTALMASAYYGMSEGHQQFLDISEFVFTGIFLLEAILRIIALRGLLSYLREPMNRLDFLIVIGSLLTLHPAINTNLTFLRIFRMLRIARLYKRYPTLSELLATVLSSLVAILNALTFLLFALSLFAILGMQLYGGEFNFPPEDGGLPRANFDNFAVSWLSMFQVLTGENWIDVMFDGMRADSGWTAPIFFIFFYLLASSILLNLFIAVILENFEMEEKKKQYKQFELLLGRRRPKRFSRLRPMRYLAGKLRYKSKPRKLKVQRLPRAMTPSLARDEVDYFVSSTQFSEAWNHREALLREYNRNAQEDAAFQGRGYFATRARQRRQLGRANQSTVADHNASNARHVEENDLGMIPLEELGRVPGVGNALDRSTLGASAPNLNGALDIEAEAVAGEDRDSLPVGDGSEPHHQVSSGNILDMMGLGGDMNSSMFSHGQRPPSSRASPAVSRTGSRADVLSGGGGGGSGSSAATRGYERRTERDYSRGRRPRRSDSRGNIVSGVMDKVNKRLRGMSTTDRPMQSVLLQKKLMLLADASALDAAELSGLSRNASLASMLGGNGSSFGLGRRSDTRETASRLLQASAATTATLHEEEEDDGSDHHQSRYDSAYGVGLGGEHYSAASVLSDNASLSRPSSGRRRRGSTAGFGSSRTGSRRRSSRYNIHSRSGRNRSRSRSRSRRGSLAIDGSGDGGSGGGGEGDDSRSGSYSYSYSSSSSAVMGIRDVDVVDLEEAIIDRTELADSLCCLSRTSVIRRFCLRIVKSLWFDPLILVCIIVSSVLLALEPAEVLATEVPRVFSITDWIFTGIFTVEAVLKIVAHGLALTPKAYLKNNWNRLDLLVLGLSYLQVFALNSTTGAAKLFRVLRALRPLRLFNRARSLQRILQSVVLSLPKLAAVTVLWLSFFLLFGIFGMELFSGKFFSCNDGAVLGKSDCVGVFLNDKGILVPRVWANPPYSFDNIFASALTLITVASLEGWLDVMYAGMDVVGLDLQPRRNVQPAAAVFFVVFIFMSSFFVVNLFIGVIVDGFNQNRDLALLTSGQKLWVDTQRAIEIVHPPKPEPKSKSKFKQLLFSIVQHDWFEPIIMAIIGLNVIVMFTEHADQSPDLTLFQDVANLIFVSIFVLEMCIKIIAYGPVRYIADLWNLFDCVVTLGSLVLIFFPEFFLAVGFARAFRVGRVFRLIRRAKTLETLFRTLVNSLPSVFNIGTLFMLFLFIFAVIGRRLFSTVKYGAFINADANFETFGGTLLLLFRMCTGENWQGLLSDCSVQPPACVDPTPTSRGDCGVSYAWVYFVAWHVFGSYIMLNLFIAVILENFAYCSNLERNSLVSNFDLDVYRARWKQVHDIRIPAALREADDPDDDIPPAFLSLSRLRVFLFLLGEDSPLGLQGGEEWLFKTIYCAAVNASYGGGAGEREGYISYQRLLKILTAVRVTPQSLPLRERVEWEEEQAGIRESVAIMTVAEFTWRWLQTYRKKRLNSILRTFALPGFGTSTPAATGDNHSHSSRHSSRSGADSSWTYSTEDDDSFAFDDGSVGRPSPRASEAGGGGGFPDVFADAVATQRRESLSGAGVGSGGSGGGSGGGGGGGGGSLSPSAAAARRPEGSGRIRRRHLVGDIDIRRDLDADQAARVLEALRDKYWAHAFQASEREVAGVFSRAAASERRTFRQSREYTSSAGGFGDGAAVPTLMVVNEGRPSSGSSSSEGGAFGAHNPAGGNGGGLAPPGASQRDAFEASPSGLSPPTLVVGGDEAIAVAVPGTTLSSSGGEAGGGSGTTSQSPQAGTSAASSGSASSPGGVGVWRMGYDLAAGVYTYTDTADGSMVVGSRPTDGREVVPVHVWHTYHNDEHGRDYFYNAVSGETVWVAPSGDDNIVIPKTA